MKKINITESINAIIVTGIGRTRDDKFVLKTGARLYSGMTGEPLAHMRYQINLPCSRSTLWRALHVYNMKKEGEFIYETNTGNGVIFENNPVEILPLNFYYEKWPMKLNPSSLISKRNSMIEVSKTLQQVWRKANAWLTGLKNPLKMSGKS